MRDSNPVFKLSKSVYTVFPHPFNYRSESFNKYLYFVNVNYAQYLVGMPVVSNT